MVRSEDICLQVCQSLFFILGGTQVAHGFLDVNVDMVPVKLGVIFPQAPGRLVTELLVEAEFLEFVKKRGALLDAVGVTELTDEIGRPHKTSVSLGVFVHFAVGNGKPGHFDV
jgi:hypothetical protein